MSNITPGDKQELDALADHVASLTISHIRLESDNVPLSFTYRQQALLEEVIKKLEASV